MGQAVGRQMQKQNLETPGRSGVIINMTSVNGLTAIPNIAGYNASKGGVTNLTRYATDEVPQTAGCSRHVEKYESLSEDAVGAERSLFY